MQKIPQSSQEQPAGAKKVSDFYPYLFLLAFTFLLGGVSFVAFLNASPASPPFGLMAIMLGAYGVGLFSAIRLLRSGNSLLGAIGLSAAGVQSLVILALIFLLMRVA